MSGWFPPNLLSTGSILTPSAVAANALNTGTLIASPGAGFRIRLWLVIFNTSQGIAAASALAGLQLGGPRIDVAYATPGMAPPVELPGGLALPVNTLCDWFNVVAAAGPLDLRCTAYYTVEAA